MTEKQREGLRKQLVKQFSRYNRYWTYNGTYFEMEGGFGGRDLDVWVTFRNRESGLEMSMQYRGVIRGDMQPPAVERFFAGEDRFGQAIDTIAEYLERLADTILPLKEERAERSQEYDARICAAVSSIGADGQ